MMVGECSNLPPLLCAARLLAVSGRKESGMSNRARSRVCGLLNRALMLVCTSFKLYKLAHYVMFDALLMKVAISVENRNRHIAAVAWKRQKWLLLGCQPAETAQRFGWNFNVNARILNFPATSSSLPDLIFFARRCFENLFTRNLFLERIESKPIHRDEGQFSA